MLSLLSYAHAHSIPMCEGGRRQNRCSLGFLQNAWPPPPPHPIPPFAGAVLSFPQMSTLLVGSGVRRQASGCDTAPRDHLDDTVHLMNNQGDNRAQLLRPL
ncbi:hypothetical protein RRG08_057831 [Elysia crispata]|uniref:Uncharacterized protein n=1 Tax=Elysia crispata TaxID=231223 RepID=A0AAE1AYR2_9GAST|nr:hypothetical protein RRG08_057831 [Elysia crispata]